MRAVSSMPMHASGKRENTSFKNVSFFFSFLFLLCLVVITAYDNNVSA